MAKKLRNYISGSAKKVTFPDGGEIINLDLKLSDLSKLPVNEAGYVKISLGSVKGGEDRFGNSHSIFENDFVPDKSRAKVPAKKASPPKDKADDSDDLPF